MKALILSAGQGTRLKPLTNSVPKVLVPVNGKPIMEYIIRWLKHEGVKDIAINMGYKFQVLRNYLSYSRKLYPDISFRTSLEYDLLGTSGSLNNFRDYFTETFFVVYGDVLADFNLKNMLEFHYKKRALATLALCRMVDRNDIGRVAIDIDNKIADLSEKSRDSSITTKLGNGGIYILEPEILDYIPKGKTDFCYDIFPRLIDGRKPVYGYVLNGDYLLDIGVPERYEQANRDVREGKVKLY